MTLLPRAEPAESRRWPPLLSRRAWAGQGRGQPLRRRPSPLLASSAITRVFVIMPHIVLVGAGELFRGSFAATFAHPEPSRRRRRSLHGHSLAGSRSQGYDHCRIHSWRPQEHPIHLALGCRSLCSLPSPRRPRNPLTRTLALPGSPPCISGYRRRHEDAQCVDCNPIRGLFLTCGPAQTSTERPLA